MARLADPHLRDRLLAAAAVEFAESGYAGATLDGIAARAGVTKGGIYFHFADKESLFFAVLDQWRERRRRLLDPPGPAAVVAAATGSGTGAASTGAAGALRTFLASYLAFHFREPVVTRLWRVLATELRGRFTARLREDDRHEQRWLRAQVRELLVLGGRDGTLDVDDPATTAFVLAATLTGVVDQLQTAPADVEPHCHAEQLAALLVARFAGGGHPPADGDDGEFHFAPRRGR